MQNTRYINLRQTRTFDEVLRTVFMFVRINFKPFLKSLIVIPGPFILLTAVLYGVFYGGLISGSMSNPYSNPFVDFFSNSDNVPVFLLAFFLVFICAIVGGILLFAVTNAFVVLYEEIGGTAPTVEQVWQRTKKIVPGIIGLSILCGILVGIASIFFFLPGIYVAVGVSLVFAIKTHENIGIFDAVSRSFSLVKGYWWQTFGILFILYLMNMMASYAFSIPAFILGAASSSFSTTPSFLPDSVTAVFVMVFFAAGMLVSLFLNSLLVLAPVVQYYNLVERKEAVGLREKIDAMNNPEGGWAQGGTL